MLRLTHLVAKGGCASKLAQAQLKEVLSALPVQKDPNVLVGFETSDDAGVYLLPGGVALVQTMDFFTPIVDDPYRYGAIAATNALSDVYAMGGEPITVMNIALFDPEVAPPAVWAEVFRGMGEKVSEAGATTVGGHSVVDKEPKFGLSVTGLVDPERVFSNRNAEVGDQIWLTKPLGTGIVTTGMKFDDATEEDAAEAIRWMTTLNKGAKDSALLAGVRCATDVTGFSLVGHLGNICRASDVSIRLVASALPHFSSVERLVEAKCTTGAAVRNREAVSDLLSYEEGVPEWLIQLTIDPQTSGGLALFSRQEIPGATWIGEVTGTGAGIRVSQ
ncbi:MAG: selenide, water dikinase SelD [Fimbriimonadaceae bacterium]|nr:selenide, water dikinase SelD [Fimbriimonadaceae bacterium]